MTEPRPPLRLVGSPHRDEDDDDDFEPVERAPHDLHPPYRELTVVENVEAAEEDPPRTPLSPRFVIVALIAFQLLAASSFLGKYRALAQGGGEFAFAAAVSALASLCLYAGAVLLAGWPGRGRALFIAAAAGFGVSMPAWGIGYGWDWPLAFGAILALAGAWFARPEVRPDDESAAQP